jgi:hypothetical protein
MEEMTPNRVEVLPDPVQRPTVTHAVMNSWIIFRLSPPASTR